MSAQINLGLAQWVALGDPVRRTAAGEYTAANERSVAEHDLVWRQTMEQAELEGWFKPAEPAAREMPTAPAQLPMRMAQQSAYTSAAGTSMPAAGGWPANRTSASPFADAAQRYALASVPGVRTATGAAVPSSAMRESVAPSVSQPSSEEPMSIASARMPMPSLVALRESLAHIADIELTQVPDASDRTSSAEHLASTLPPSIGSDAEDPPAVRLHAEWSADGVRVWLGADRGEPVPLAALVNGLHSWLAGQRTRLLSVVCNGRLVWPAPAADAAHRREAASFDSSIQPDTDTKDAP
ncbi:hypothetical protein [Trinickia fusca]|uniref:Uncharacterized protein n=1 Tax=Trinickia fusca TaxID=2419777 RepID=A0A494XCR9_9BURK|nr:hypothetical protein [Trinickia fusca]RKP48420.1 hypothetical protein D7S89_14030 [Trinickia fusca]